MARRNETVTVKNIQALRWAGPYSLVVATVDPRAAKDAPIPRSAECLIPKGQIDGSSKVKVPGDRGDFAIPRWLADDREFVHDGDEE